MTKVYIGKRLQRVPHWQYPDRNKMPKRYQHTIIYTPQMATVVAINMRRKTYTIRYDKTGLLETVRAKA